MSRQASIEHLHRGVWKSQKLWTISTPLSLTDQNVISQIYHVFYIILSLYPSCHVFWQFVKEYFLFQLDNEEEEEGDEVFVEEIENDDELDIESEHDMEEVKDLDDESIVEEVDETFVTELEDSTFSGET